MPRLLKSRFIPANAETVELAGAIVYKYTDERGRPCAVAYVGRAVRPTWHYNFLGDASREGKITELKKSLEARAAQKSEWKIKDAQRRAELAETIKPGTILYSSWGYEQTNIDFWLVIGKASRFEISIQHLGNKEVAGSQGFMSASVLPNMDARGAVKLATICAGGVRIRGEYDFMDASLWDGKEKYASWYA